MSDSDEIYDPIYVKRHDLRPNEISEYPDPKEYQNWQWWITHEDLSRKELTDFIDQLKADDIQQVFCDPNNKEDPIERIRCFCNCHRFGIYPPPAVMNDLFKRFSGYLDDNEKGKSRRLGEYFGEPANGNRRGKFRDESGPDLFSVCAMVHHLENWFYRPNNKALDIAALYLEKLYDQTPKEWQGEKKKGRESLRKEYLRLRRIPAAIIVFNSNNPTPGARQKLLKTLGRDCLTGHPDLLDLLDKAEKEGTKN